MEGFSINIIPKIKQYFTDKGVDVCLKGMYQYIGVESAEDMIIYVQTSGLRYQRFFQAVYEALDDAEVVRTLISAVGMASDRKLLGGQIIDIQEVKRVWEDYVKENITG